jgi:hypothetical protein
MTFPNDHAWPGELPPLRLAGHVLADVGVGGEPVAFERGEDRQRTRYTVNPRLATVSTLLTQAQYDRFVDFVENELWAAARRFDVRVATEGGVRAGLSWWSAQFVGPPREVPRGSIGRGVRWEVFAELLLLDGPYATRTAPSLRGQALLTTALVAQPVVDSMLRGRATLTTTLHGRPTVPPLYGQATLTTSLTGYLGSEGLLLEDGEMFLDEAGEQIALES